MFYYREPLEPLFKLLYNLFPDYPAKREDYKKITGSEVFPLPFSRTRWIEDKRVADRTLEIWPNIANEEAQESSSNIKLLCHVQIICTGLPHSCKALILCLNSICYDAISSEVPRRYSSLTLLYCQSNCVVGDIDAEIYKAK